MSKQYSRAGRGRQIRWLAAALLAAGWGVLSRSATGQTSTTGTSSGTGTVPGTASGIQDLNQALLAEGISLQFYNLNAGKAYLTASGGTAASSDLSALNSMIQEIRAGHQAHVTMLQQILGANAQPMPALQNLDAGALPQFLTMAQTLEDIDVGVHQGVLVSGLQSGSLNPLGGTTAGTTSSAGGIYGLEAAILDDDARYDGAIRAFQRTIPTAAGGSANGTLTQSGTPLSPGLTFAQASQALQTYLVTSSTGSTSSGGTAPSTTGTTPTPSTTGTTPSTTGTTPSTTGITTPSPTGTTPSPTTGTTTPAAGGSTTPAAGGSTTPPAAAVSFSKDILRIFTNNGAKTCAKAGCHGGSSPQLGQNLSAATAYANIVNVPSVEKPSLMRVKPGDAANSYLYQKITGAPGIVGSRMPLAGGPLSAGDIALIQQWINAGAPNN